MTAQQLANITQRTADEMALWLSPLESTFERYAITTRQRKEMFLAQVALESGRFLQLEENLNYSATRLRQVFPRYFRNEAHAKEYARNPESIANLVYANRMGNGSPQTGDGYRYRGRGLKHLTGKWNYEQCANGIGIDIVSNPDLLLQPEYAALSAGWFWHTNKLNRIADSGNFEAVTRKINGGLNGLSDRVIFWQRAKRQGL